MVLPLRLRLSTCLSSICNCLPVRADSVLLIIIWSNLNSLPVRLFWGADSSGQRKSNRPLYLFNESDLLSSSYLLPDCLGPFLAPSVTLLRSVTSLHCLPFLLPLSSRLSFILIRSHHAPVVSRWSPTAAPLSGSNVSAFSFIWQTQLII